MKKMNQLCFMFLSEIYKNAGFYRGPSFELMASARLTLDDIHDGIRTHDLKLENPGMFF